MPIFVPTQGQGALLPLRPPQASQQQFEPLNTLGAASLIQRKQQIAQQDIQLALRKQQLDFQEQLALAQNEQEFFKSVNQNHLANTAQSRAQKAQYATNSYGLDPRFYAPAIQEFDSQISDALDKGMKSVSNATNLRDQRQAQADLRSLMTDNYRKTSQNKKYQEYLINQNRYDELESSIAEATAKGKTVNYANWLNLQEKMRANGENKDMLYPEDFNMNKYVFDQNRVNTLLPATVTEALDISKKARAGKQGETYEGMATTIEEEIQRSYDDAYDLAYERLIADPDVRAYAENLNMMPGAQKMSVEDRVANLVGNELKLKRNQDDVTITAIKHEKLPNAVLDSSSSSKSKGGGSSGDGSLFENYFGDEPKDGLDRAISAIMDDTYDEGFDPSSASRGDLTELAEYESDTYEQYFKGDEPVDDPKDADRKVIYGDDYDEETGEGTVLAEFTKIPEAPQGRGASINVTGDAIQDVDQAFSAIESGGWANPYEAVNTKSTALGKRQFLYTDFREPIAEQLEDLGIDWEAIDLNDLSDKEKSYFQNNKVWSSAERRKANGLTDDDKKKAVAFLRNPRAQDNMWEDYTQDTLLPDLPVLRRLDPDAKYSDLQLMYIRHHEGGLPQAAHFLRNGKSSHKDGARNITRELNNALTKMEGIQTRSGITGNFDEDGYLGAPKQDANFLNFKNRNKGEEAGEQRGSISPNAVNPVYETGTLSQPQDNITRQPAVQSNLWPGIPAAPPSRGSTSQTSQPKPTRVEELEAQKQKIIAEGEKWGDDVTEDVAAIDKKIERAKELEKQEKTSPWAHRGLEAQSIPTDEIQRRAVREIDQEFAQQRKKESTIDDVLSGLETENKVNTTVFSAGPVVINKSNDDPPQYRVKVGGLVRKIADSEEELREYLRGLNLK